MGPDHENLMRIEVPLVSKAKILSEQFINGKICPNVMLQIFTQTLIENSTDVLMSQICLGY